MPFNVIICGGGLGGLGAAIALKRKGHNVTVLEEATQLAEVGAGIQIPPNSSRILSRYGLKDDIEKLVVWPQNINFRRYCTGVVIGSTFLDPRMSLEYGFPYWLIHRADYQRCLYEHAKKIGVKVLLNHCVDTVDTTAPSVKLANGKIMHADLIVGADGIRSRVRAAILGDENVHAVDSSNCAYRATVPKEVMLSDPEVAHLMSDINSNCWIGHQRHIMAYPIRNGEMYNLVMSHPGKAAVGKWNEPGNIEEMRDHYDHFDPTIKRVVSKVTSCLKWKLADLPPLPRWVSESGRVVVMGDAAHAMVPYLAQGAAPRSKTVLPWPNIRKARCDIMQAGSRGNGDIWNMPDGPEQEQRDRDMLNELQGKETVESDVRNPNRWSDRNFQPWLFGYDTFQETSRFLAEEFGAPEPSL